ncbi:MAG: PTS glucose transporter subunit IIA [Firmicutes bacterium]|nr:PTS glucose transporter subunit IIA [Bacillota bacterium]
MFGRKPTKILAPVAGSTVPLSQVKDAAFSTELLGKGLAIKPTANKLVSPINGRMSHVFKTGHAATIQSDDGIEILIHIGINTVELNGANFKTFVSSGQQVKVGDPIIEFDREKITAAGYDTIIPILVVNHEEFKNLTFNTGMTVQPGTEIMTVKK